MRKRCGILTINVGIMNYGNRLQNYALQEYLQSLGFDVQTVKYKPAYDSIKKNKRKVNDVKRYYKAVKRRIFLLRYKYLNKKKREKFTQFINEYINWTKKEYYIDSDYTELKENFDYIVCGSDQVWNPYWEGTNPIYFMEFIPKERRIAYAASFGVSDIPKDKWEYYKRNLHNIPYISCREDEGVHIIEKLISRKVPQVIDPVFLMNPEEWKKIEDKPSISIIDKPYILVYVLGEYERKYAKKIKEINRKNNFNILFLDKADKRNTYFASPAEFIYLIRNAAIVCTDSFHGAAFSILFNRPFICFRRSLNNGSEQDMSVRLDSLMRLFQCENRFAEKIMENEYVTMDYENINKIIHREKKSSSAYLKSALGIK